MVSSAVTSSSEYEYFQKYRICIQMSVNRFNNIFKNIEFIRVLESFDLSSQVPVEYYSFPKIDAQALFE